MIKDIKNVSIYKPIKLAGKERKIISNEIKHIIKKMYDFSKTTEIEWALKNNHFTIMISASNMTQMVRKRFADADGTLQVREIYAAVEKSCHLSSK